METRNYYDLIDEMKNIMISRQDVITDFNQGSMIMTFFEAVARVVEKAYLDTRFGYDTNLQRLAYSIFKFEPKNGTFATGKVQFTLDQPATGSTIINRGTRVSDGSHVFETTEICSIEAGSIISELITIQSVNVGSENNVAGGTITTIVSDISGNVSGVINIGDCIGGTDKETDTETLERFRTYINGLQGTNKYGIKSGVLAIEGVKSVSVKEIFDSPDSPYNVTVYVDSGQGTASKTILEAVDLAVNGNDTPEHPGLRPAGVKCEIKSATPVPIDIKLAVKTYNVEEKVAKKRIENTLKNLINDLAIGAEVKRSDIIISLRQIDYVLDVTGIQMRRGDEDYYWQNISINDGESAAFGNCNIEVIPA